MKDEKTECIGAIFLIPHPSAFILYSKLHRTAIRDKLRTNTLRGG
jgi:hypothetical protein